VADPVLRERLTPHFRLGCKRVLLSDDYYPAVCQEHVELVTERIAELRARSIVTEDGCEREVDSIIVATGFHATDIPLARHIHGRSGRTLADAWSVNGQQAYLGTTVAGFPNLFLLTGPNTGQGHTSMVYMIESQLAYILDCLRAMHRRDVVAVEVRSQVQRAYNDDLQRRVRGTVWASGCSSWHLDKSGRNPTIWPGFTWDFRRRTRRFKSADYVTTRRGRAEDLNAAPVGSCGEPSTGKRIG